MAAEIEALEQAIARAKQEAAAAPSVGAAVGDSTLHAAWDPGRQVVSWHKETAPPILSFVSVHDPGTQTVTARSRP